LDLANAFVRRPEFQSKYPLSLDGPGFVDAVLATIRNELGVELVSQRSALIDLYTASNRDNVIYRLADDSAGTNPINNRPSSMPNTTAPSFSLSTEVIYDETRTWQVFSSGWAR